MLYATVRQRKIHVKNPVTVIQNGIGVDRLMLDMDEEWREMSSIVCVFTTHYTVQEEQTETVEKDDGTTEEVTKTVTVEKEIVKEMLHTFGEAVLVPWENLKESGSLSVSCTGYVGDEKVMTTMKPDSFWSVVQNGPVTGEAAVEATPELHEQVLAAAGKAEAAAKAADNVAAELQIAKEKGEFDGKDGVTPGISIGRVTAGTEAQVTRTGTSTDAVFNFVLPRGPQGEKGEKGQTGPAGAQGPRGVQGPVGPAPIRGVDYWTAADRAAVVAETLAALPTYNGEVV